MTPQESTGNSHAMTRRTFIKTGSLLVGGAAVSGLELEPVPLAYATDGEGRTLQEGSPAEVGMSQARLDDGSGPWTGAQGRLQQGRDDDRRGPRL